MQRWKSLEGYFFVLAYKGFKLCYEICAVKRFCKACDSGHYIYNVSN